LSVRWRCTANGTKVDVRAGNSPHLCNTTQEVTAAPVAVVDGWLPAGNCNSEDLQGGGVFSVVVGLYDDLHVLIEGDEEAQKALHGELAEVAAQH
jgi:hypothetical protein